MSFTYVAVRTRSTGFSAAGPRESGSTRPMSTITETRLFDSTPSVIRRRSSSPQNIQGPNSSGDITSGELR